MGIKSRIVDFFKVFVRIAAAALVAVAVVGLVLFVPLGTALLIVAGLAGIGFGLAMLPLVAKGGAGGTIGQALGNLLLMLDATATGGKVVKELRTGNYETEKFDDGMVPKKHQDLLHGADFAVTFENHPGCFADAAIKNPKKKLDYKTVDCKALEQSDSDSLIGDDDKHASEDGRIWFTEGDLSSPFAVRIPVLTKRLQNKGTTEMIEDRQRKSTSEEGGDTSDTTWKAKLIGMIVFFVLGFVVGVPFFLL